MMKVICSIVLVLHISKANTTNNRYFPSNFVFGVSTSAYQIEGAWNESGKGENIWDFITHNYPSSIADGSNGDIACDSYHKIDEDIALLKNLGVNFYRFSLSWTRILPDGDVSKGVNLAGVTYYKNLLEKLKQANIDAMVTLYHFDGPEQLHREHLFVNESLNSYFVDYARLAFLLFGNDVKYWATFNEPKGVCTLLLEAFTSKPGTDTYTCAHNIIKSHAMVYRVYEKEFKPIYGGQVGIVLNVNWQQGATDLQEDIDAAQRQLLFEFGWFAHPLTFGDYPDVMKDRIRSYTFFLLPSRLPKFTSEDKELIKGTMDFIGLNHYTSNYVTNQPNHDLFRTYDKDCGTKLTFDPSWKNTSLDWLKIAPFGMRKILKWIDDNYNTSIIVTENGYVESGTLIDDERIDYFRDYLSNLLDAIYIDKVNVVAYSTWSLMDNFEWTSGYTQKFGLYYVNFSSPTRERIPKKSVAYFKKILETRCLVDTCVNQTEQLDD